MDTNHCQYFWLIYKWSSVNQFLPSLELLVGLGEWLVQTKSWRSSHDYALQRCQPHNGPVAAFKWPKWLSLRDLLSTQHAMQVRSTQITLAQWVMPPTMIKKKSFRKVLQSVRATTANQTTLKWLYENLQYYWIFNIWALPNGILRWTKWLQGVFESCLYVFDIFISFLMEN